MDAFRSKPGQGERVTFRGQISLIRAHGEHTGGLFSLLETRTPQGGGPPPHVHEREDEAFFILDGEFAVTIGEETSSATPGTFVFAPRGVPHAYVATQGPGRHLTFVTPPGFEGFFADVAEATIAGQEAVAAVARRYGVTMFDGEGG
jgi:quercetin dioxygenase-like cupin family protein